MLAAALSPGFISKAQQPTVTKVATGENDTLFIKSDGSLWGMGANTYGELGDGTNSPSLYPEQIVVSGVTAIAVGNYHSLFLKTDGSLWAMGYNNEGQLGDGTYGSGHSRTVPEQIVPSGVTAIAAGSSHSLFLKSDGSLWGMGDNSDAQLYKGPAGFVATPLEMVTSGVRAIAAGGNHELFIKQPTVTTVELWGMGDNAYGQLGDGNTNTPVYPNSPVLISSVNRFTNPGFTAVATGVGHSLFVESDGSLWAMGNNDDGELGDGTSTSRLKPEKVVPSGVAAIAAGDYHSIFLKNDGSLWAMGDNYFGELGDNNTYTDPGNFLTYGLNSPTPEQIVAGGTVAVGAGGYRSLFVRSDGSLWGMGDSGFGELGDGGAGSFTPEELVWPPPPPLGITTYSNQPVVIFPAATGSGYVVQMTTNLASSIWITAPNGVPFSGVQFTNAPPNVFFRLQPP